MSLVRKLTSAVVALAAVFGLAPRAVAKDEKPEAEKPDDYTLENGLRVRLAPRTGDQQVMVLLFVRAGFLDEPAGLPHLAHVTEHLTVFDLPAAEAKAAERWFKAGKANGETLADVMYFDLLVTPDEAESAVKVQAARLSGAEFSKETLAREVPRTLQEVAFVEKSKFPVAGKFALAPFVQAALHGKTDQPLRARTEKIAVADVTAFHRRTFRPDRAGLVVAGEFDPTAVRKQIDATFGAIKKPAAAVALRPKLKAGESTADWDVKTRHLFVAWPAPDPSHADHPPLTLASLALTEKLMTDAAFTKLASGFPQLNDTEGVFMVGAQAAGDADLGDIRKAVLDRVTGLAKPEAWTKTEVTRLREQTDQLLGADVDVDKLTLPKRVTKTMAVAQMELQRMSKALVWGEVDAYRKRLAAVTPEEVAAAVAKHLPAKEATVVRVERAKK